MLCSRVLVCAGHITGWPSISGSIGPGSSLPCSLWDRGSASSPYLSRIAVMVATAPEGGHAESGFSKARASCPWSTHCKMAERRAGRDSKANEGERERCLAPMLVWRGEMSQGSLACINGGPGRHDAGPPCMLRCYRSAGGSSISRRCHLCEGGRSGSGGQGCGGSWRTLSPASPPSPGTLFRGMLDFLVDERGIPEW